MSIDDGLPPGWTWATLGEVADINPPVDIGDLDRETPVAFVPMAAVSELSNRIDTTRRRLVREVATGFTRFATNDVIFAKITPCMENGKIAVVPDVPGSIAFGSTEFHVLRCRPGVLPLYVHNYLVQQSFRDEARRAMSGAVGQQRVAAGVLRDARIPLPPAAEQARIVAALTDVLSDLEAGEAALVRAREALTTFRASLLHAAVTGQLTEAWRAANPPTEDGPALLSRILAERRATWERAELARLTARGIAPRDDSWRHRYQDPDGPRLTSNLELPAGWTWATVEQLSTAVQYGTSARCKVLVDGVPVLRMGNLQDGKLDLGSLKHLPADHDEFPDLLLDAGDVLFNRTNSAELVGKTAVFEARDTPYSFASYLIRVKCCVVRPHFVAHFINSPLGRRWIDGAMTQQVGQANVSGGKLKTLAIPLPPLAEQDAILEMVEAASEAAIPGSSSATLQAGTDIAALRQSILHAAFTGRLVPQDPGDEPAAALLARLRATPAAPRRTRRRTPEATPA